MIRTQISVPAERTAVIRPSRPAAPIRSASPAATIRPGHPAAVIRPACPADRVALGDFLAGLSVHTLYLRFFAPVTPTPALLNLLSGGAANIDAVVAVRDGVVIGHAMAVDPQQPAATDVGVVVADAWQGQGVGSALIRALVARAQARGVTSIAMDVLHVNRRVLAMIGAHWPAADIGGSPDYLTIKIGLPRLRPLEGRTQWCGAMYQA
ncbi:MAG: GNAT family N-acetyltransferase [Actinobacteria bacterium]|nr:GNAT family N-acetyltransferase [Actinomycetota bacterium]